MSQLQAMGKTADAAPSTARECGDATPPVLPNKQAPDAEEDEIGSVTIVRLPVTEATCVPGLHYSVSLQVAVDLGWKMAEVVPMGRSGKLVLEKEIAQGEHICLHVPVLAPELLNNGNPIISNLDSFLPKAMPDAVGFIAEMEHQTMVWKRDPVRILRETIVSGNQQGSQLPRLQYSYGSK